MSFMQAAAVPAFTGSGLYQTLLEGTLLLLGTDPAAYPQTPEVQLELWDSLKTASLAGAVLAVELAVE
jgi:hypothetical protein